VKASPYFSCIIDETTDSARLEQLIIYVRYLEHDTHVRQESFDLTKVPCTKAESVYVALVKVLENKGLVLEKGLASG
jgi:hypothetical protein